MGVAKNEALGVEFMGVFVQNGVEFESFCPFSLKIVRVFVFFVRVFVRVLGVCESLATFVLGKSVSHIRENNLLRVNKNEERLSR